MMNKVEIRKDLYFIQEGEDLYGIYKNKMFVKRRVLRELTSKEILELATQILEDFKELRKFKDSSCIVIDNIYSEAFSIEEKKAAIKECMRHEESQKTLKRVVKWLYEKYYDEMPFIVGMPRPDGITVSQEIIDGIFGED